MNDKSVGAMDMVDGAAMEVGVVMEVDGDVVEALVEDGVADMVMVAGDGDEDKKHCQNNIGVNLNELTTNKNDIFRFIIFHFL